MAACNAGCNGNCTGGCSGNGPVNRDTNTRGCSCASDCSGGCSRGASSNGSGCWCGSNCSGCGGCSGGCSGCSGDCSGCSGSCGGSCSGTCTGNCKNGCTGSCKTGCQGNCKGECSGSCNTKCTNGCGHLCNSTCVSDVAISAYNHLKTYNEKVDDNKYIYDIQDWMDEDFIKNNISHLDENTIALDWLDKTEINYLLSLLQEEGRRRVLKKIGTFAGGTHPKTGKEKAATTEESLSKSEKIQIGILDENGKTIQVKSGDFVTDQGKTIIMKNIETQKENKYQTTVGIKELNNLLLTNTGKQIDISSSQAGIGQNQTIKRKAGEAIIQKALSAWNETIGIASTSDSKGVQTVG